MFIRRALISTNLYAHSWGLKQANQKEMEGKRKKEEKTRDQNNTKKCSEIFKEKQSHHVCSPVHLLDSFYPVLKL